MMNTSRCVNGASGRGSFPASFTGCDQNLDMSSPYMNMKHWQERQTFADLQGSYPISAINTLKKNQVKEEQNRYFSPYTLAYDPQEQNNVNVYSPFIKTTNVNKGTPLNVWNTYAPFVGDMNNTQKPTLPPNYDASYLRYGEEVQIDMKGTPSFQTNKVIGEKLDYNGGCGARQATNLMDNAFMTQPIRQRPVEEGFDWMDKRIPPAFPEDVGLKVPLLMKQLYDSEAKILSASVNDGKGFSGYYSNVLHPSYVNESMTLNAPRHTPVFH